jgi:Ca2+-binding EF-hand superfamily protein
MVSSISSTSAAYSATQTQETRSVEADKILKAVDTNQDGKITEDELSKAMAAQGSKQGSSAAELFKQLDQGSKGYITKQDLEDGLAKTDQAKAPSTSGSGGGGGGGGGSSSAGGATSTTTSYDPADLNQDGVVSAQERIEYAQKAYTAQHATTSQQSTVYA